MEKLRTKLMTCVTMMVLAVAMLIVGIWAVESTKYINLSGSVNFDIADKSLYVKDVKLQTDMDSEPETISTFMPGYINGTFNMNLGTENVNDYGSFALYFYIINTVIDGETMAYSATATCTQENAQENVRVVASGVIEEGTVSPEQITLDMAESGIIKLTVSANPGTIVDLSTITVTLSEYIPPVLEGFEFSINEADKTATLTAYTGTDSDVVIPSTISTYSGAPYTFTLENLDNAPSNLDMLGLYSSFHYKDSVGNEGNCDNIFFQQELITSVDFPVTITPTFIFKIPEYTEENADMVMKSYQMIFETYSYAVEEGSITEGFYAEVGSFENQYFETLDKFLAFASANFSGDALPNAFPMTIELANKPTGVTFVEGDDYMVTAIGDYAFSSNIDMSGGEEDLISFMNNRTLTSVEIPSAVTNIGEGAFAYCINLNEVKIDLNGELNNISSAAFGYCVSLTSISLPKKLETLGDMAFGCPGLVEIYNYTSLPITASSSDYGGVATYAKVVYDLDENTDMPESRVQVYDDINYYVYENEFIALGPAITRKEIGTADLHQSTTNISTMAFMLCTNLTSITIPENVTDIEDNALSFCYKLEEINFNAIAMNDFPTSNYAFSDAGILGDGIVVNIGDQVTRIPANIFSGYDNGGAPPIIKLDFGKSSVCTSIGEDAFYGCRKIISLAVPDNINSNVLVQILTNVTSLAELIYSDNPESHIQLIDGIYYLINEGDFVALTVSPKNVNDDILELDERTTSLHNNVFYNCENITSILLPRNVTSIGESAFYSCGKLSSITLPSSLTSIGGSAFYGCRGLTSITLPSSLTSIGDFAFQSCSGLTSIDLPSSLTSIGYMAFLNSGITTVKYQGIIEKWLEIDIGNLWIGEHDFIVNGEELTNLVIPEGISGIPQNAFVGCSGLTSVVFPSYLTKIEDSAFSNCSGLTSITLPSSLTSIGSQAFRNCSGLTRIDLSNCTSLISIGASAFSDCSGLTSISLPSSLTSIGDSAFYGCRGLKTINFPTNLKSIGALAFENCDRLASLTIPSSVTSIDVNAFYNCDSLTNIIIDSKNIYSAARSASNCGYILQNARTVRVLASIDDGSNTYLNNNFTKTTDGEYNVYTKN